MSSGAIGRPQIASDLEKAARRPVRARRRARRTSPRTWARDARSSRLATDVAGQLLEHERTAARLAGHATPVVVGEHRVGGKQAPDQPVRLRPRSSARAAWPTTWSRPARSSRARRNGFAAVSSLRKHSSVSMAGAPGGRSSSSSSTALSASAHCRSSMHIDERLAIRETRRAARATPRTHAAADPQRIAAVALPDPAHRSATASHLQQHRETRASTPAHRRAAAARHPARGIDARWRLRSSMTPSSALYGTDSFS